MVLANFYLALKALMTALVIAREVPPINAALHDFLFLLRRAFTFLR